MAGPICNFQLKIASAANVLKVLEVLATIGLNIIAPISVYKQLKDDELPIRPN